MSDRRFYVMSNEVRHLKLLIYEIPRFAQKDKFKA